MTLYSPVQLAELLSVSVCTVQRRIRAGDFGETVNVARQHLVTEAGLAAFVAAHTGPASTQTRAVHTARHKKPAGDPGPI